MGETQLLWYNEWSCPLKDARENTGNKYTQTESCLDISICNEICQNLSFNSPLKRKEKEKLRTHS